MADIPIEKKSSKGWLWLLLLLLLVGLIIWWLAAEVNDQDDVEADTVAIEQTDDPMTGTSEAGDMSIAAILTSPEAYYGTSGFNAEVGVGGPLTDRGFWIEQDGARMFALIIDQPAERPIDINEGATLRLNGGVVRDPAGISGGDIVGEPLDNDTLEVIADQEAILVIDEANITIVNAA
jgi:hypothetical protein